MKNREIADLKAKIEAGGSLTNDEQLLVLQELLRANRRLLRARDAGFVVKEEKPRKAKDSAARAHA